MFWNTSKSKTAKNPFTVTKRFTAALFAALSCLMLFAFMSATGAISDARRTALAAAVEYAYLPTPVTMMFKNGAQYEPATSLPATYFVAVIENENADGYLKVSYLDITGYVRAADVEKVDYEPKFKYAEPSLLTFVEGSTTYLRSRPFSNGNSSVIADVPSDKSLVYYGTVDGDELYTGAGNKWYYVRYNDADGEMLYGYLYSAHARSVQPIKDNTIEKVEPPPDTTPPPVKPGEAGLPKGVSAAIIACLSLPAVGIMFYLFFKGRGSPKKTPRSFRDH